MITIKNWDEEIQKAKEEVIMQKEFAWQQEWKDQWFKEHKDRKNYSDIPSPPSPPSPPRAPKEITEVKAWFIAQWDTGFVCVAMDELMKVPKKQRDKILKLGGI